MKTSYETLRKGDVMEDTPVLCVAKSMLSFVLKDHPAATMQDALKASLEVSGASFFQDLTVAANSEETQVLALYCVVCSEDGILVFQRHEEEDGKEKHSAGFGGHIMLEDAAEAIIARLTGTEKRADVISACLTRHLRNAMEARNLIGVDLIGCVEDADDNHVGILMAVVVHHASDVVVDKDVLKNAQWVSPKLLAGEEWQDKLEDLSKRAITMLDQILQDVEEDEEESCSVNETHEDEIE